MKPTAPTQLSPALALVQLLSENPGLPAIHWSIRPDGILDGHLWDTDTRATAELYRQILGITSAITMSYRHQGQLMVSEDMTVTWRDVRIRLSFRSLASVYGVTTLMAAVA
ncbi:hypothetical protein ACFVFS_05825 [Kitasatospora sp. NPDC057692]|uniref:hypothetical protein n=1 Tax=Kitasatospora sp. NPDC057692 TaxID=3346215 RepID=UPI0036B59440